MRSRTAGCLWRKCPLTDRAHGVRGSSFAGLTSVLGAVLRAARSCGLRATSKAPTRDGGGRYRRRSSHAMKGELHWANLPRAVRLESNTQLYRYANPHGLTI